LTIVVNAHKSTWMSGSTCDGSIFRRLQYRMPYVSRREFLTAIAAAAVPRPQLERFVRGGAAQRIVVIGGGLAGLWGLDRWERGSFALHTPGQIGFLDTLAAPEGRIHFAGEHTSPWTGWLQGALESARRVVREITA
jgi:hypothetical protein